MPVGKFGEKLRRERESRGITLEQIAESTKISSRNLRALEEENFGILPGGIFNKGFVRSYARFLGINEEQAVSDYMTAAGEKLSPEKLQGGQIPDPPAAPKKMPAVRDKGSRGTSPAFWAFAFLLLLVALALGGKKYYFQYRADRQARAAAAAREVKPEPTPAATPVSVTTDSAIAPTETSAVQPDVTVPTPNSAGPSTVHSTGSQPVQPVPAPEVPGSALVVEVHAARDAWMEITVDGAVTKSLFMAGTDRSFRGTREIKLLTGNAGGIEVSFNGKKLEPLGPEGAKREMTFTPNN